MTHLGSGVCIAAVQKRAVNLQPTRANVSRRRIASRFWCGVSFGLRPIITPFATARAQPSPVRARINSRSKR
jgi:hypothetical protein